MSNKKQNLKEFMNLAFARTYILTINNPEQSEQDFFDYCKNLEHIKYFIFQREKGESGTEHYQVYVEFSISKRFATIKGYFPKAHIEARKGTKTQAKDYCSKEKTRIGEVYEFGEFIEERERTDIAEMTQLIKDGISEYDFNEMFAWHATRFPNFYSKTKALFYTEKFQSTWRDIKAVYIYGSTGVGKTRYVTDKYGYENVYTVTNYKHPFDRYNFQDVILFDEFRSQFLTSEILNYLDGYPLSLPCRYYDKIACYTKVYIISNIPLSKQYPNIQISEPETYAAIVRRIKEVYCFDNDKDRQKLGLPLLNPIQQKFSAAELMPIDDNKLPF